MHLIRGPVTPTAAACLSLARERLEQVAEVPGVLLLPAEVLPSRTRNAVADSRNVRYQFVIFRGEPRPFLSHSPQQPAGASNADDAP